MRKTLKQISTEINGGQIKITTRSHSVSHLTNRIMADYSHYSDMVKKYRNAVKLNEPLKEGSASPQSMLDLYKGMINVEIGNRVGTNTMTNCADCGEPIIPFLIDENTIEYTTLNSYTEYLKKTEYGKKNENWKEVFDSLIGVCSCTDLRNQKYLGAVIDVPTGDLVFCNHFGGENGVEKFYDFDKMERYTTQNDICHLIGRKNLTDALAKHNIGYGQTTNTSLSVYANAAGDEIIISSTYGYDSKEEEEYDISFDGFVKCGDISCDVWRWQCADKKILIDGGVKLPKLVARDSVTMNYMEYTLVDVQKGKWEIKHYFDFIIEQVHEERNPIYSHLKLIK